MGASEDGVRCRTGPHIKGHHSPELSERISASGNGAKMITMNQFETGHESHLYDAVRIAFGAVLLVMGLLMAVAGLLSGGESGHLAMVLGVAVIFIMVGSGMLARQSWSRWGFYLIAGMMVLGAGEAALRAQVLARNVMWDRPIALAIGFLFAWGLWMLSRHEAKEQWRVKD